MMKKDEEAKTKEEAIERLRKNKANIKAEAETLAHRILSSKSDKKQKK